MPGEEQFSGTPGSVAAGEDTALGARPVKANHPSLRGRNPTIRMPRNGVKLSSPERPDLMG